MKRIFELLVLALVAVSCATPAKITYFQDLRDSAEPQELANPVDIRLREGDKISVVVNSKNPELADLFNVPINNRYVGSAGKITGTPQGLNGYTVDKNGEIDFPIVGLIKVGGLTRLEAASYIKQVLVQGNFIKDPTITVEYMNLTISVLGEVTHPGRYNIDKDYVTILDVLGMAGDLTIYGKRENILVMRAVDGKQEVYNVDLCSASQLYSSPVYYLQQGDVVYVEPNDVRARQSTVNGNNIRSTSFWLSLGSLLTSVAILIIR